MRRATWNQKCITIAKREPADIRSYPTEVGCGSHRDTGVGELPCLTFDRVHVIALGIAVWMRASRRNARPFEPASG